MQGEGGLRGGEQGVTPVLRLTARVCGHAGEAHVELGGGHKVIAAADHRTGRNASTNMNGREIVHVIQRPGGNHGARAARAFFSRLEDQLNGAVEPGCILLKHLCQSQTNGGVAVVRAGVHHTRIAGGKPVAERAMAVVERFA